MSNEIGFLDYFSGISDHRIDRKKLHPMEEILLLTVCAVICGCEGWADIELFGNHKLSYLRQYLPYANGIPSDDTLRRFFRAVCAEKFRHCFLEWVNSLEIKTHEGVIAIDGKTSRHSFDADKSALHLVSAFASEARIVLGQVATDEKSNEITAIPKLLELLDLKGSLVTIDAMGCQHKIADKITTEGGDYLLALKGNQGALNDDVRAYFEHSSATMSQETYEEYDKGHGRVETRKCTVITELGWLKSEHPNWDTINSIVRIESKRDIKEKVENEPLSDWKSEVSYCDYKSLVSS